MSDIAQGLLFAETPLSPVKFNLVLYGPAKSGKSTAAATAEGPILWVNLEGPGALGFARKVAAERGTTIHEVQIGKDDDPRPTLREVVRHLRSGDEPHVRTVVIDTVGKLREGLAKKMVEKHSKNSLSQWGDVGDVIKDIVGVLRDEPVNVVLLCHEDIIEGDGDEPRIVKPLIGGKATEYVLGEVDVIGYTHALQTDEGVRYVAQLVEGRGRRAGDRSGGLGTVRDLDLTEWWEAYCAALTPDTDLPWSDTSATLALEATGTTESAPQGSGDGSPLLPDAAPAGQPLSEMSDDEIRQALKDAPDKEPPSFEFTEADWQFIDAMKENDCMVSRTAAALGISVDLCKQFGAELKKRVGVRSGIALVELAERHRAA